MLRDMQHHNVAQRSALEGTNQTLWLSHPQEATTTNVTLNGTIATAHVFSAAGPKEQVAGIISEILGLCPQGKHLSSEL